VDFRILGPLEVENAGGAIALGTAKQQALLGVLLLHPNEVVSGERLIDELWGERPPPTAAKVVQTYVSQLRKCLGREAIVTRPPGYLLRVDEGAIDAGRFRRLTAEGRLRAADGDRERAEGLYREALALWRGPPLTGLVFESFARNEVERLEQERLAALIDGIDCGLALGRDDELVPGLETLVKQHPLQERLRAQLMLALYRSGRQAEALAVYQDARRVLVDALGLEPTRRLQELERAILTHDEALEAPTRERRETGGPASGSILRPTPEPREERKVVTVLVADLGRFTSPADATDPEDVRAWLAPYHRRLRSELERFGATVETYVGDAVMAFFGAPLAHEDDPERALRAALAIRDWAMKADGVQLRIAIKTGEALVALGMPAAGRRPRGTSSTVRPGSTPPRR
jgi:DNA-binding SARP family transcriptional activator